MKHRRRVRASEKGLRLLAALPDYTPDAAIADAYERRAFGSGWRDYDGDGEDARAEVLLAFHRGGRRKVPIEMDGDRVVAGRWICRFSHEEVLAAGELDIDHLVPLREAWVSGAHAWERDRAARYANGQGVRSLRRGWLIPVLAGLNRSKGAKRPDEWMPPSERYHVHYAREWVEAKHYWKLAVLPSERDALIEALAKVEIAS